MTDCMETTTAGYDMLEGRNWTWPTVYLAYKPLCLDTKAPSVDMQRKEKRTKLDVGTGELLVTWMQTKCTDD